jgi:hypothetical protein
VSGSLTNDFLLDSTPLYWCYNPAKLTWLNREGPFPFLGILHPAGKEVRMDTMHLVLYTLLIAWGAVSVILVCALIYRSMLESHEDDQIFLDAAGDSMAKEQRLLVAKIEKLNRPITSLIVASSALLLVTGGLWVWQMLKTF